MEIVEIRQLSARRLDPLLREEIADWGRELDWDFSKSADLVRRFAHGRRLGGAALLDRGEVAGYGYTGFEDHKGLIADVYVRVGWRGKNAEALLFRVLLDALIGTTGLRRIESQLMLMDTAAAKGLQRDRGVRLFERLLMKRDADDRLPPGRISSTSRFRLEPWVDQHHHAAATAISLAYAGHVDAQINEHYRTLAGASRFLHDLVEFPGCATFHRPASYIAFEAGTGRVAGISLASFVADEVAHITELCVTPDARGVGLGYELLRQSAATLADAGAKRISLTVTAGNEEAVKLYTRFGFREARRFGAYVWEGAHPSCRPIVNICKDGHKCLNFESSGAIGMSVEMDS